MRRRSAVTTAAVSIFGLVLAACAIPEAPGPNDSGSSDTTAVTASATSSGDRQSMEGQYTFDTMDQYVDKVVSDLIVPWLNDTWPSIEVPDVRFVPEGISGREGCEDSDGHRAQYSTDSYEYCPPDVTVYVGQDAVWEFYSQTGDAGPAMGLAHEFGHHVQYSLGVTPPETSQESVAFENQADCLAGTWARWADAKGYLDTAENSPNGRSDLDDIELLFPLIASAEGADRDHGTLEERESAFNDGYRGGPPACDINAG
ncbi:MAG TPA: neutral zinc metallopeptidase [Micromonosporaceae bacterium]|jgi:predicted metalloprotease